MKILYQAADRIEAQLLKDHLRDHHIETLVQGEYLSGGVGELPALQFPLLWVIDDRDLDLAKRLIREWFSAAARQAAWVCPNCGESNEGQFRVCWNCGLPHE